MRGKETALARPHPARRHGGGRARFPIVFAPPHLGTARAARGTGIEGLHAAGVALSWRLTGLEASAGAGSLVGSAGEESVFPTTGTSATGAAAVEVTLNGQQYTSSALPPASKVSIAAEIRRLTISRIGSAAARILAVFMKSSTRKPAMSGLTRPSRVVGPRLEKKAMVSSSPTTVARL